MNVIWLNSIKREDYNGVGEKAAGIAKLYNAGFPVPYGFCVTDEAFRQFLEDNGIRLVIRNMLKKIDENELKETSEKIQAMIMDAEFPYAIKKEILEYYGNLNVSLDVFKRVTPSTLSIIKTGRELPYIAVRSSLSSNGVFVFDEKPLTFLNIRGITSLINAIKSCWASLYSEKALIEREDNNLLQTEVSIGILIQKQVNCEKSGVVFTSHEGDMLIEAGFGLGEAVISNQIKPDRYLIDKSSLELKGIEVNKKEFMYTRDETMERTKKMRLDERKAGSQALSNNEIKSLAMLGNDVEKFFNSPRDIEFGVENGRIYIIQTKAYTKLKMPFSEDKEEEKPAESEAVEEPVITNIAEEKPKDDTEALFKMFDEDGDEIEDGGEKKEQEKEKEVVYSVHGEQKISESKYGDRIIADFAGIKIELPKSKDGVKIMRQILDLIEGQL